MSKSLDEKLFDAESRLMDLEDAIENLMNVKYQIRQSAKLVGKDAKGFDKQAIEYVSELLFDLRQQRKVAKKEYHRLARLEARS